MNQISDENNATGSSIVPIQSQQQQDVAEVNQLLTNTSLNVDRNDQTGNGGSESKAAEVRRPNVRKKEHPKQFNFNFPAPQSNPTNYAVQQPYSAPVITNPAGQNLSSVQDIFRQHISPLYAATSSRYLENMSHHPQYQYQYRLQNSPPVQQYPGFVPTSPQGIPQSLSPQFLNNIMQHPLLCHSVSPERQQMNPTFMNYQVPHPLMLAQIAQNVVRNVNAQKRNSKRCTNDSNHQKDNDKKFDSYISIEAVEEGLAGNKLLEGVVRINPKQFQHSYVSSTDRSEQDILIDGIKHRNRALEGDIVVVELIQDVETDNGTGNKQKKGKVVYIKDKVHTRKCIGTLKLMPDKNRQKALFVPRDHRIPRLNIPSTCWPDNFYKDSKRYENTLFLAQILDWTDTRFAIGTIVSLIGQSGNLMSETTAILAQNDLDITPFGPEVRDLYPRLDYVIPEDEIKLRMDCRKMCIFSIDPYNCRDIDDAVSCQVLANGNYEIGVHISDVAHFLTENTILDEKVADKATTIYLVDKAYHMLPDELCMLCSLFPGVDKLAFSVFWEITKEGVVLGHKFSKTVINSCCQLAYEHAQAILDNRPDAKDDFPEIYNGHTFEDVKMIIKILGNISSIFRTERFNGGALRIDQPKVAFRLNATTGLPDTFSIYESKPSHQLIEEFMLLANMSVANRIYKDHPQLAFLRCHPVPSGYMLNQLEKALKPMGIDLDISTAGSLHRSLQPYVGPESTDRGKAMVLNMLCAKPMTRAKYFCADGCDDDDFHHYALNVPLYTHFTSPIRRYADIMVHRLLAASLNYREEPNWKVDDVQKIAANCNKQKYNAKRAGEMAIELYTLLYIEINSPVVTEAVVVEVKEKYIDVIVVAMGLNRRIFFNNDFPGKFQCIKNDAGVKLSKMELTWNANLDMPEEHQVIEVFSILQVEMHKGDDMVKVETKLVRPSAYKVL